MPVLFPEVTVTDPSFATSTFASVGRLVLAFLTAVSTAFFSSLVKSVGSFTLTFFAGAFKLIVVLTSSAFTVLSGVIVSYLIVPSGFVPIGTVTVPLAETWISSFVNPRSGLAVLTASLTASFSASVRLFKSDTCVFSIFSLNFLPVLSKGLTVSLPSSLPVLSPSVTVTFPLPSTVIIAVLLSFPVFASLTAFSTACFSVGVRLLTSLTSTLLGAFSLITLSSSTTVLLAGTSPTLPPFLTVTLPVSSTVMSSFVKFKSGLAAIIASLTLPFSSSVNPFLFLTSTGFAGGLMLFITSFCLTVWSAGISPVFPPLLTITLPSFSTVISFFVRPKVLFAAITASLTLSFSPSVRPVLS